MYPSLAVANYFIDLSRKNNVDLNQQKLQRLVYFAHGWHLALFKKPLLDETVDAWQYGPIIRSVYYIFKPFGNDPITKKATSIFGIYVLPADPELKMFLDRVWEVYGRFDGIQLSNMAHKEGTPWHKIWHEGLPLGTNIPPDCIQNYFESVLKERKESDKLKK